MGIKVTIHSNMPKKVNSAKRKFESSINDWVNRTGLYFRRQIAILMTISPATGKTYIKDNGIAHTASSIGNPPRPDTGMLRSSIQYRRTGIGEGLVSTNMDYAEDLEFKLKRYFMGKQSKAYRNTKIFGKQFAKNIGIR